MNYKSFADLSADISSNLYKIPSDVDLIVGIPRSGLLAASVIALNLNLKFCDLASFIENRDLAGGITREARNSQLKKPLDAKRVLIVDDSVASGNSILKVKESIANVPFTGSISYLTVYGCPPGNEFVDVVLCNVDTPRLFQWNLFHRIDLKQCCVDIDGVLCLDPTKDQNDDGERYLSFIKSAQVLMRPSYPIGHIVTSRLEKYRGETEGWLKANAIAFERLHMFDGSAKERRRLGLHADFKAAIYSSLRDSTLFIESESAQAQRIMELSKKPVLDFSTQHFLYPDSIVVKINKGRKNILGRARKYLVQLGK